ncbi:MAG: hypothetical protein QHC77_12095 [Stenotrophomonas sp.]|uniref:hypothetical protein n=1 Tax=Stenotrophomonas sp. TaxID=69392 RepID=UPI00126A15CA|nr:hypothetical protein [Stenotrophomonas sp.]MDX3932665.1 hypothetical protein [Stenotrophomonas sp.]
MNKETEEMTLAPVAGWDSGVSTQLGIGFFTLKYLVSPTERVAQAHSSPRYALTAIQLRDLAQRMLTLAEHLENNPPTSAGSPQH